SLGEERDGDGGLHACAMLTSPAALRSNEDEDCLSARFHCSRPQITGKTITGNKNQPSAILSSQQDERQNEESGFYTLSSPSPRDEGVGRGEVPVNTAPKRPRSVQGTPLPAAQGEST